MAEEGFLSQPPGFATKAIHVGKDPEKWNHAAAVPPITMSATFKRSTPATTRGYEYGRTGNPSRQTLEEGLAALDNAKYSLCFASGLGAITAVVHLLKTGDHILSVEDLYGGTYRVFSNCFSDLGIEGTFVDGTDISKVEAAIKPNTRMLWVESPSNPQLKIIDIKALADLAHKYGNIFLVVDNTFLTSYFQRPLELGADIVMYSLTKFFNGHADVIMGATTTNNEHIYNRLQYIQNALGIVPSPFDCSLMSRSLNTLHLRMPEHMKNGLIVARYLEKHPLVEKVIHPGLPSHPQHELAKRQSYGHSGMVTFFVKGNLEQTSAFLCAFKLILVAGSLGGHMSSVALPCLMTHKQIPKEELNRLGIAENMVRLSIGLESPEDIIADLEQAFRKTF